MLYSYRCTICGEIRDYEYPLGEAPTQILADDKDRRVDHLHGFQRVYGIAGIVFKGQGFYTTDSRRFKDVDTSKVPKHMLDR